MLNFNGTDFLTPRATPITQSILNNLAGSATFQRGNAYFLQGLVNIRQKTTDQISARVQGSENYRVELRQKNGNLKYECTCPHAADGYFCKHCVAVGLAWLSEQATEDSKEKKPDPITRIRHYLQAQSPSILIELLLNAADRDNHLFDSLLRKADFSSGSTDLQKSLRQLITQTTTIRGFIDWNEAHGVATDFEQMVEALEDLLTPEHAAILIDLAEYAIERIENALQQIDDSNGDVSTVIDTLCDLHCQACALAKPEPLALAERLFHLQTASEFEVADFGLEAYEEVLDTTGLQRYRELAEAEWMQQTQSNNSRPSYRIKQIMEQLAKKRGDIEALVAIKARDITASYGYLTIAEIYHQAGQHDKALEWAEQGLKSFPNTADNRLRDFLVTQYLQRKRYDEAVQLTWIQFEERPSLEYYQKLHTVTEPLGIWPNQRERALAKVVEVIANSPQAFYTQFSTNKPTVPNYSLRVAIALWEDDLDEAWAVIQKGICDKPLLITLAEKLAESHPYDAIYIYQRLIPAIVEQTNNAAYEEGIRLINQVGKIMRTQARKLEFNNYIAELRGQFKVKRNFIKLLNAIKL